MRGLVTAIRTLTILPVPGRDADRLSAALPWFPLVGCGLGFALYGLGWAAVWLCDPWWPAAAGLVVVTAGVVLTRGLHLDGLSDWADAFAATWNRERALAILKDTHVGAFGVIALVLALLAKFVAVTRLANTDCLLWIVAAVVASRMGQVELAASLPYARAEGGTAAGFVAGAGWRHRLASLLLGTLILVAVLGPAGVAVTAAGWLVATAFGLWCRVRLGGVTGDLLGAGSELIEITILLLAAALAGPLAPWLGWEWVLP